MGGCIANAKFLHMCDKNLGRSHLAYNQNSTGEGLTFKFIALSSTRRTYREEDSAPLLLDPKLLEAGESSSDTAIARFEGESGRVDSDRWEDVFRDMTGLPGGVGVISPCAISIEACCGPRWDVSSREVSTAEGVINGRQLMRTCANLCGPILFLC